MRPRITHVAIKFQNRIWSLPMPYRHHHVLRMIKWLADEFGEYTKEVVDTIDALEEEQGFLDESGIFLNRKQAMVSAALNDQIKPGHPTRPDILYSEDVW